MNTMIIVIEIFAILVIGQCLAFADGAPEPEPFGEFEPRFYNPGIYQEGRNICLALAFMEGSYFGIDKAYALTRYKINPNEFDETIFEEHYFINEQLIVVHEYSDGEKMNLILLVDECLNKQGHTYKHVFFRGDSGWEWGEWGGSSLDSITSEYFNSDTDCEEIDETTCTAMDLSGFHDWAEEQRSEQEDDDKPPSNTDDDDDDVYEKTASKKAPPFYCGVSNDRISVALAGLMLLVGLVAIKISARKRANH